MERIERQSSRATHSSSPWKGFAHPEHRPDELEGLLRTLRFASIQLNKFWVEMNAFPVFMNELKGASLTEIERPLDWFRDAPAWGSQLLAPKLIAEMADPRGRDALMIFKSQLLEIRALRASLDSKISWGAGIPERLPARLDVLAERCGAVCALAESIGLLHSTRSGVRDQVVRVKEKIACQERVDSFFLNLAQISGLPVPSHPLEAEWVFQVIARVKATPESLLNWRMPQFMEPQARSLIEAWQGRARPILEARSRLVVRFKMDGAESSGELRALASVLRSGGLLKSFSGEYKRALKQYQDKVAYSETVKPPKISVAEMSDGLNDWAGYLEQRAAYEGNSEARVFFGSHFKGIDTDFAQALEAYAWASQLRAELHTETSFCATLVDWACTASVGLCRAAVAFVDSADAEQARALILGPEYERGAELQNGRPFQDVQADSQRYRLLVEALAQQTSQDHEPSAIVLGMDQKLSGLLEVAEILRALSSKIRVIEASPLALGALKSGWAGENTPLEAIDQVQSYWSFIEAARLSDALRQTLLSVHGPQRLSESARLASSARGGLAMVKDHLQRLYVATRGATQGLENQPLHDVIRRIERALKQPGLFSESIGRSGRC